MYSHIYIVHTSYMPNILLLVCTHFLAFFFSTQSDIYCAYHPHLWVQHLYHRRWTFKCFYADIKKNATATRVVYRQTLVALALFSIFPCCAFGPHDFGIVNTESSNCFVTGSKVMYSRILRVFGLFVLSGPINRIGSAIFGIGDQPLNLSSRLCLEF